MSDKSDWKVKRYSWVGPQVMSNNGLELRSIVAEDQHGRFHAGTRYGPKGIAMPELGPGEFWQPEPYKDKDKAIEAAKQDTGWTLNGSNAVRNAKALIERATTPAKEPQTAARLPGRARSIDR